MFLEKFTNQFHFSSDELSPAELLNIAGGLKDSADRSIFISFAQMERLK